MRSRSKTALSASAFLLLVAVSCARAEPPPTPAESLAALRLADPSLKIELVASDPDIVSPVAFAWDETGRLFVAEMTDYPAAATGGRVKLLEDRDNDGRYERVSVFADKLPYPNGVLPWNGGVLVTAAPDLLFLKDTDGDGKADVRRVVLTGFGEGNQQLRVNSPTWGLDNWVYLANGRSGGAIRRPEDPPAKAVPIPRNDLRLDPATGRFEPVAGFSQFGLPRDDRGDRFPSWNTVPVRHVVLEDRVFARDPDRIETRAVADILDLSDGGRVYSLAPTQRRFNVETVSYFNATCGPTVYRGDVLGSSYRGDVFICEPLTSLVHHRRLEPSGPTYVARRVEMNKEFLASTHPWFRPVNLGTGPDGALYVADFCRAWVEHPAFVPEKLRNSVDFREGHERGRLWRISSRTAAERLAACRPGRDDVAGLVAHFEHANGWCRDTAQRLLVERKPGEAVAPLRALARSSSKPLAKVHALWTLDGLAALDDATLEPALRDREPIVREAAARLSEGRAMEHLDALAALADDPDARVRLRAAVCLATLGTDASREGLARIAARDGASPWTSAVVLGGVAADPDKFLATLTTRLPAWLNAPNAAQARFLSRLAERIGSRNREPELLTAVRRIAETRGDAASFALLLGLAQGQARVSKPLLSWNATPPGPLHEALASVARVRAAAGVAAGSNDRPSWIRVLAFDAALASRADDSPSLVLKAIDAGQPVELQAAAARGVARVTHPTLVNTLLERWDGYALATRRTLVGVLVASPATAATLLEAVSSKAVAATEIDPASREELRRVTDPKVKSLVGGLFPSQPVSDRGEVVRKYADALKLKPDLARGRTLFATHCQTCHARDGQGAKVGPDLISVVGRPSEDLLTSILDPGREAAPDGLGVILVTNQGQTFTGLLAEETPTAVRLRRAGGLDDVIPRSEIEALRPTGRSLMPDGLEQVLNPQDLADLISFLRTPVKAGSLP